MEGIDIDNILIAKKPLENILIYDISYKTLVGSKALRIRFDNGIIRVYDGTRYSVSLGPEKYDGIYKRIRYHIRHHIYQ